MAHALNDAEVISTYVGVLRSVNNKSFLSQAVGKVVIEAGIDLWIRYICWSALQAVLAYHHRPAFPFCNPFRYQQYSIGEYLRPNVEDNFIAFIFGFIIDQPGPRIGRQTRRGKPADN